MSSVAYFVSAHGYGHAARACAVMEELVQLRQDLRLTILTTVPRWFFSESLSVPFVYHELTTDVGLVQKTSFEEDAEATVQRLRGFLPPSPEALAHAVDALCASGAIAVVCDISPLGLLAAQGSGLPAVLIENFTWDWIYQAYMNECPELAAQAPTMEQIFARADHRVQTEPVCAACAHAQIVAPVSRRPRVGRAAIRRRLGAPEKAPLVLLTMGGVGFDYGDLRVLENNPEAFFVVAGGAQCMSRTGHLIALPHSSQFYHPDLVHASDLVVGKLGYSTVAEVYHSRAAFAFVSRTRFPESPVLADFVVREMEGVELSTEELATSRWLERLDELLASRVRGEPRENGAADAARIILGAMDGVERQGAPHGTRATCGTRRGPP